MNSNEDEEILPLEFIKEGLEIIDIYESGHYLSVWVDVEPYLMGRETTGLLFPESDHSDFAYPRLKLVLDPVGRKRTEIAALYRKGKLSSSFSDPT
jgi:hypothetical protein